MGKRAINLYSTAPRRGRIAIVSAKALISALCVLVSPPRPAACKDSQASGGDAAGTEDIASTFLAAGPKEATMAIQKVSSKGTEACPTGEVSLVAGAAMAMRMWQDEEPQEKQPHRSEYETLGYVIAGVAELIVGGESVLLEPGDSYLVRADTEHTYRILETFTAVECTSPPAIATGGNVNGSDEDPRDALDL